MEHQEFTITYPLILPNDHRTHAGVVDLADADAALAGEVATRVVEIHLQAMDSNPLLHAQFPTPSSLAAARKFLTASYRTAIVGSLSAASDGRSGGILVTRMCDSGEIIGFATWENSPGLDASLGNEDSEDSQKKDEKTKLENEISNHVQGCRKEFLDQYARLATQAKDRYFGGQECYQLSFVCTDPAYQGKGVGTAMTRKVLELATARREGGLPVYLESTLQAVPMYQRLGFKPIGSFEMTIPSSSSTPFTATEPATGSGDSSDGSSIPEVSAEPGESVPVAYREICMVRYP